MSNCIVRFEFTGLGALTYPEGEPRYFSDGAAAFDLRAAIEEPIKAVRYHAAGAPPIIIPLGLAFALPQGWELQFRSRSGLAAKNGVVVTNSPGTIDSDYRDEVKAIISNHGPEDVTISPGDRIVQAKLAAAPQAILEQGPLDGRDRGGGLGSTGKG